MKEVINVNHIGIRVRDMKISQDFYEQLGFRFIEGPVGPEPIAVMVLGSGFRIHLILNVSSNAASDNVMMRDDVKHAGYTHMALEVSDIVSIEHQLRSKGIVITEKFQHQGTQHIFIRDPDANVIEFNQTAFLDEAEV